MRRSCETATIRSRRIRSASRSLVSATCRRSDISSRASPQGVELGPGVECTGARIEVAVREALGGFLQPGERASLGSRHREGRGHAGPDRIDE